MLMQLPTFQTFPVINKAKITTECFYRTLFTTTIAIFPSVKENARIKFWFSASLFPKQVVKVTSCINKQSWNVFKVKLQGLKIKRIRPYHGCGVSNIRNLACVSSPCLWLSMLLPLAFLSLLDFYESKMIFSPMKLNHIVVSNGHQLQSTLFRVLARRGKNLR